MLIKVVSLAIPIFVISCFKILKTLCTELESLMAKFWWSQNENENKIHWIGWNKMYLPKFKGGLGFKILSSFNISLLVK